MERSRRRRCAGPTSFLGSENKHPAMPRNPQYQHQRGAVPPNTGRGECPWERGAVPGRRARPLPSHVRSSIVHDRKIYPLHPKFGKVDINLQREHTRHTWLLVRSAVLLPISSTNSRCSCVRGANNDLHWVEGFGTNHCLDRTSRNLPLNVHVDL